MSVVGPGQADPRTELIVRLGTTHEGLTDGQAAERRVAGGSPLRIRVNTDVELLARQFRNPVVILLTVAAMLSMLLSDIIEASIIVVILVSSGLLGYWQERGATRAVAALAASVEIGAEVLREGRRLKVRVDDVVVGDIVILNAGDVVPADGRVIAANRLQIDESTLTGENVPRSKSAVEPGPDWAIDGRRDVVLMGTHVVSGEGRMIVTSTGAATEFGIIVSHVGRAHLPTSFERGVTRYGTLLATVAGVLVSVVLVVNLSLGRDLIDSALFSLALAVGMTPQMLPAIVTLSMSRGAQMLARRRVIVKRLDAIEDVGSIDVVCTDKTGTLTEGAVTFAGAFDPAGRPSDQVLLLAHWNAHLQSGFDNPIDEAIVTVVGHGEVTPPLIREIPFDFDRRMVSVVVEHDGNALLVTKGSAEEVLRRCVEGTDLDGARRVAEALGGGGERVLAVAVRHWRSWKPDDEFTEAELTLAGFVRFTDPVKVGAEIAIGNLAALGVEVKMITGDSVIAAAHVAVAVGLTDHGATTGDRVSALSDDDLRALAVRCSVFAEVDPVQKERIVRALSACGKNVAFLGDGINDVAAMHAADVGISVDGAADAARQVADLVLLDKDLGVLAEGIRQGRRVFLNTLKYVNVTTSANFGNMLSLAVATAFFPYLPLLPLQILLLNFLSDIPAMTIATDRVDDEMVARPVAWQTGRLARFMVVFGLVSTAADLILLAGLRWWLDSPVEVVRTGWFIESCLTEIVVMLSLRTWRPLWHSTPSRGLVWASVSVATICVTIPWLPFAAPLGFAAPGLGPTVALVVLTGAYVAATELLKTRRRDLLPGGVSVA